MANNKGKKFDAHEKHFKKKEVKMNREINYVTKIYHETKEENTELRRENRKLEEENRSIKAKYEQLLQYHNLSDEEIKEAIQKSKSVNKLVSLIDMVNNFS